MPSQDRFSGREDRNVEEDLSIFEGLCEANLVPISNWALILCFSLKGDARRFFRTQTRPTQSSCTLMKKALLDRCLSPQKLDRTKNTHNSLRLKDFRSLEAYGEELLRLHKFLPEGCATEEALIDP